MNDIKEYKQLTTIQLFEGEIFTSATIDDLDKMLNSESKFIRIGDEIIAKNQIKKCYVALITDIQDYIMSLDPVIQEAVKKREIEKKQRVHRGFDSIQEIDNRIKDHGPFIV